MNKDKKVTIMIVIALLISVIGLGIAFAAFSTMLTINGSAQVESSSWEVVFEGADGSNTIGAPTTTGTAAEVTRPTIKNSATEISTYSVTLQKPGDSITYNFKVHNKGSFAANLGSLTISGVNRPSSPVTGANLVTDSSTATANASTLAVTEYKFYYTNDNSLVGQNSSRDCLEPGESVNVSLKITFASTSATDTSILPSSNLTLDNLGITAVYNQTNNSTCPLEPGYAYSGAFENIDLAYYTYEGKSFIGTGVHNVIISENIISKAKYASTDGTDNGAGADPRYTFADSPAEDAAISYCTGCRLMTKGEAGAWEGCTQSEIENRQCQSTKIIANYQGSAFNWWLADAYSKPAAWLVRSDGLIRSNLVTNSFGVRPAVSISSTATMTGSGTQAQPYVITTSN